MPKDGSISSDLIRGHIETIILRSLYDGDKHGNEISLYIEDKSGGEYQIKQPTLYSALGRLTDEKLINSYWSSGAGGRRRYYGLTDAGRKVCEDNFNDWIHSRNIIDMLISDGVNLGYPVMPPPTSAPDVSDDFSDDDYLSKVSVPEGKTPKFDPSEFENYSFIDDSLAKKEKEKAEAESTGDEFVFDQVPVSLRQPDGTILKKIDDADPDAIQMAQENESNLSDLSGDGTEKYKVEQLSLMEENEEESEIIEENEPEIIPEEKVESPAPAALYQPAKTVEEPEILSGDDDAISSESFVSPDKKYRDILSSLFTSSPESEPEAEEENDIFVDEMPELTEDSDDSEEEISVNTNTVSTEDSPAPLSGGDKKPAQRDKAGETDYTDIFALADRYGFRVKTSDRTNYAATGRLFVNKVNALSAAILFFAMIVETLALLLPFNDLLGFSYVEYLYIGAGLLIFPIITWIILIFNPGKKVDKIATLTYCMSVSFVVVLNLILLNFAVILITGVDLNIGRNILLFIVAPIIAFLNVPLFFIIKYSLVSKGVFLIKEN